MDVGSVENAGAIFQPTHKDVGSADIVYVQEVRYQGNAGAITEEKISA